jgi:hypothetical protein
MFDRLLSCDTTFKEDWETGTYSIPEDTKHKTMLSKYIKKQSTAKKLARKINNYIYNKKLIKGAKNLLQAYMIQHSQEYMEEGKDMDKRIEEMFCGIFKQISIRKKSYIDKIAVDSDAKGEITSYLSAGTRKKRFIKNRTIKK